MEWKITRILLLSLALAVVICCPAAVMADSTAEVTIHFTPPGGAGPPAPSSFTATYLDDYTVLLEWSKSASANNTMVRVKDSGYPTSATDGYLVYLGDAVSVNDTAVDYYNYWGMKYYAAWSDNISTPLVWSADYAAASLESPFVSDLVTQVETFNALVNTISGQIGYIFAMMLVLGFLIFALWKNDLIMYIAAGILCVTLGVTWIDDYSGATMVIWIIGLYMLSRAVLMAVKSGGSSRGLSQFKAIYNRFKGHGND